MTVRVTKLGLTIPQVSLLIVSVTALLALVLVAVPLRLPIGPNYWDVYLFLDVAHRIDLGQVPHRDFFVPIGILPFYLHDVVQFLFPNAQPVLAVQYGILLLALPLALLTGLDIERRSRWLAGLVLAPFAIFALLPFNIIEFYPSPGIDGFGIYNRQAGLMLYLLVAALFLCSRHWLKFIVSAVVLLALLYIKVTAGLAAACIIATAIVSGHFSLRGGALVLLSAVIATAGLEIATGLPRAYLADLAGLVEDNTDSLADRILTFVSLKFDVLAAVAAFGLFVLWQDRNRLLRCLRYLLGKGPVASPERLLSLRWLAGHPVAVLAALTLMATGYETQNTGSNEYIFLWPAVLLVWITIGVSIEGTYRVATMVLICAIALPTLSKVLHKAARTAAVAPGYVRVATGIEGPLAMTLAKPVHSERANVLARHYATERESWLALARNGQKPSAIQYSEPDYQTFYVRSIAEAAQGVLQLEALFGKRFESTHVLDFVDPLTPLLKRIPPRFVSVAMDPDRTFPVRIRQRVAQELAAVDALIIPRCPITPARLGIEESAASELQGRQIIALSRCWDIAFKSNLPAVLARQDVR